MIDMRDFADALQADAAGMGVKAFGVADLERLAEESAAPCNGMPEGFLRAVVMGIRLQRAVLESI